MSQSDHGKWKLLLVKLFTVCQNLIDTWPKFNAQNNTFVFIIIVMIFKNCALSQFSQVRNLTSSIYIWISNLSLISTACALPTVFHGLIPPGRSASGVPSLRESNLRGVFFGSYFFITHFFNIYLLSVWTLCPGPVPSAGDKRWKTLLYQLLCNEELNSGMLQTYNSF